MTSKKDRRHSGYVSPTITISKKDLVRYDLFIDYFYDDWTNYRDGFRDWYRDFKTIKGVRKGNNSGFEEQVDMRIRMNRKQEKLLLRRKLRKYTWNIRNLYK
jgi:hypothetical protein